MAVEEEELELEPEELRKPLEECSYQELIGDVVDLRRAEKSLKADRERAEARLTVKLKREGRSGVTESGYEAYLEEPDKPAWDPYKLQGILQLEGADGLVNALLETLKAPQLKALVKVFPDLEGVI